MNPAETVREVQERNELDVYSKRGPVLVRGKGAKVWDEGGREYIDAAGAYGVASLGHASDVLAEAVAHQARTIVSVPGAFYSDVRARYLEKLVDSSPKGLTRAFLCNSGTESIEAALKFARHSTGRTKFVCANRGFHGRTMGALSATFSPKYKKSFEPLVPGFTHVAYNDLDSLERAVTDDTAGVLLEVVQGEGGVHLGRKEFLRGAQQVCRERGALLLIDEVQTGFCRTGRMFASMHFELEPDILCVAKGMAGGLPMGATVCSDRVTLPPGLHGSTFGGNPLCAAAALAVLEHMVAHRLDERARSLGDFFVEQLRAHELPGVRDVRHLGLMIGIELKQRVTNVLKRLQENGVIALPAGTTVLRLLPPLVITEEELSFVADKIRQALS
jgi:acetylornithine/LysW-gamma-L-lysine aminotransferase